LNSIVFNTEAHILPRFKLARGLKTGWERKPRDSEGKIIQAADKADTAEKVTTSSDPSEEVASTTAKVEEAKESSTQEKSVL